MSEILIKRQRQTDIARVFAYLSYKPLGIIT